MEIYSGKSLLIILPDLTIEELGATCQGVSTGGRWSSVENVWYINVLELEALRLSILSLNSKN